MYIKYKPMFGKYGPPEKYKSPIGPQHSTVTNPTFEKKWLACLWVYYLDFATCRCPTLPSELYRDKSEYLKKNGILTSDAFAAQTVTLRRYRHLYVVKPRPRVGTKYSIPFLYMISQRGISRLSRAGVVSPGEKKKMENIISRVAKENGISVRV